MGAISLALRRRPPRLRGFRSYGDAADDFGTSADNTVSYLRTYLSQAQDYVNSTSMADSTKAAIQGSLLADSARIDRLDGDLRAEVLAGTLTPSKWAGIAQVTLQDIAAQASYTGDSSYLSAAIDTVKAIPDNAIKDLSAAVHTVNENLVQPALSTAKWTVIGVGVAIAGLLGFGLYQISQRDIGFGPEGVEFRRRRPSTQGYRRRRKKRSRRR